MWRVAGGTSPCGAYPSTMEEANSALRKNRTDALIAFQLVWQMTPQATTIVFRPPFLLFALLERTVRRQPRARVLVNHSDIGTASSEQ